MGLFDRYCSAESRIRFPELYKSSQNAQQFNVKVSQSGIDFAVILLTLFHK